MINPVSDQDQRLEALNPEDSFIVQAPAGSGKTELLIQRFLVLLARVEHPEDIIAITFTRKAAAEMRDRIIGALQKASQPEPATQHERQTWRLAQQALDQNDQQAWDLLKNPSRLRIQTIDSLCSLLVRRMPWVSRMGAGLSPEEDARHLHQKAARRTLELLYSTRTSKAFVASIDVMLRHLDNNMGRLERLLGEMLGKRDQWIRHIPSKQEEYPIMREELETALQAVNEHALERVLELFPEDEANEVVAMARFAARNLRDEGKQSDIRACMELERLPDASIDSLPAWRGIVDILLTTKGVRRKSYTKNQGFPPGTNEEKQRIKEVDLHEDILLRLHELRKLPPCQYDHGQWKVLTALMHLLMEAVKQLRVVFQQEGSVDFMETAMAAQRAVRTQISSGGHRPIPEMAVQHLLVDEFQDTSQSQYELLRGLTHDWGHDQRTLFLVGDPMQSIYGFREAEVSLFSRTRNRGLGAVLPKSLVLQRNFRSSPVIVSWVNRALADAFSGEEDPVTGGVSYSPSTAFREDIQNSTVKLHPFLSVDPIPQAERVVRIISETRKAQPNAQVAVLVQARTHLIHIIDLLRRSNLAFRSVEIDALGKRPVVRDLKALTQALLHPGHRAAWLSVLRAPWCGLTLKDLQILVGDDIHGAIEDLFSRDLGQLSSDGRVRMERIIPILREACTLKGRIPVRRWVEGVWLALGGPACLQTRLELEDAMAYLDLLERSVEGIDLQDERKFLGDVERLFAPSDVEAGGELQLLTIHKAKGLEFDTVILPGLGFTSGRHDSRLLMWREYNDGRSSNLLLAPIHETGSEQDPVGEFLSTIEKKRRDHENTRLLYVAATRARKDLHLVGHINPGNNSDGSLKARTGSLLSKIWTVAEPEFLHEWENRGQEDEEQDMSTPHHVGGVPLVRLSSQWRSADLPAELTWTAQRKQSDEDKESRTPVFEWVGDLQKRVGIVVHRMLQQIRYPGGMEYNERVLRNALSHQGLSGDRLKESLLLVQQALKNTVEDHRGQWILSHHTEDRREYEITAVTPAGPRRFILDRTFVDKGRRWIVDYKTSTHSGSDVDRFLDSEVNRYRSKMEEYARAMRATDSRPIFLGLYFPALKGWRQWEYTE